MRTLLIALVLLSGCATIPRGAAVPAAATLADVPSATLSALDAETLAGTWYVVATNFAYWERAARTDVRFVYTPQAHDGPVALGDVVLYRERGRERRFVGFDLQDPTRAGHFQWQGHGALRPVKNQWYVVHLDPEAGWGVIYFSGSNFGTGAGLEIITRSPTPGAEVVDAAVGVIRANPELAARGTEMLPVRHAGAAPTDWDLP